jgi:hypothetical protein
LILAWALDRLDQTVAIEVGQVEVADMRRIGDAGLQLVAESAVVLGAQRGHDPHIEVGLGKIGEELEEARAIPIAWLAGPQRQDLLALIDYQDQGPRQAVADRREGFVHALQIPADVVAEALQIGVAQPDRGEVDRARPARRAQFELARCELVDGLCDVLERSMGRSDEQRAAGASVGVAQELETAGIALQVGNQARAQERRPAAAGQAMQ